MAVEFRGQGGDLKHSCSFSAQTRPANVAVPQCNHTKWLPLDRSDSSWFAVQRCQCGQQQVGSGRDHELGFRGVRWPRWKQPRPSLTQRLSPTAPGASTPSREKRQMLRSGDILDQFNFTERETGGGGAETVQRQRLLFVGVSEAHMACAQ